MKLTNSSKVLIVEDDYDIATIYSSVLSGMGFNVMVAKDANEALTQVLAYQPDVILLDIMIPGTDGLEVLRTIREAPQFATHQPRVLITSNLDQQEKAKQAKAYGAQGYLVKANIDPHQLGPIVQQLINLPTGEYLGQSV